MADKAKDDAQRQNVTDETIWGFVEELDTLTDRQATATSAVRNCRKRAKAAGVDLEILDLKLKEKRLDADRRVEMIRIGARYETLLGLATTLDLSKAIQAEFEFEEPDDQTRQRITRRDALQDGLDAGKTGKDRGANPHEAGTLAYQAYDTGWVQGNETRQALADPNVPADAPRRRGRPRKAQAPVVEIPADVALAEQEAQALKAGDAIEAIDPPSVH